MNLESKAAQFPHNIALPVTFFVQMHSTTQASVQFHLRGYTRPALRRLATQIASAIEISINKHTIAAFSAELVPTKTVLTATTGNSPAHTIGLSLGW